MGKKDEERKAGNVGCVIIFFIITFIASIIEFSMKGFTNVALFGSIGSLACILIALYINKKM